MRTCALWKYSSLTTKMDICLKESLQSILNLSSSDVQWPQAKLPISKVGLGIKRISYTCLPAFLSAANGVQNLVSQ